MQRDNDVKVLLLVLGTSNCTTNASCYHLLRPYYAFLLTPFSGYLKRGGWWLSSFVYHTLCWTSAIGHESKMRLRWADFTVFPNVAQFLLLGVPPQTHPLGSV